MHACCLQLTQIRINQKTIYFISIFHVPLHQAKLNIKFQIVLYRIEQCLKSACRLRADTRIPCRMDSQAIREEDARAGVGIESETRTPSIASIIERLRGSASSALNDLIKESRLRQSGIPSVAGERTKGRPTPPPFWPLRDARRCASFGERRALSSPPPTAARNREQRCEKRPFVAS